MVHLLADLRYHWTETKPGVMRQRGALDSRRITPSALLLPSADFAGPLSRALTLPLSLSCGSVLRGHFPGSAPRRLSPLR